MKRRRLFFALWPTAEQRTAMEKSTREWLHVSGGRPVSASNLHVTLAFLGSVPEPRLAELAPIAHRVAVAGVVAPPVHIAFECVEYWKKARVLCAVPASTRDRHDAAQDAAGAGNARETANAAGALAAALKTDLVAAGFTPDLKPFRAHVTLARNVPSTARDRTLQSVLWRLTELALVESHTESQGAAYRVLESFLIS